MNTNKNSYTLIYATIFVVVVAFLLAFISKALEPQSQANERIDKKKQILASLGKRDVKKEDIEKIYAEFIVKDMIINAAGEVVNAGEEKDQAGFLVSLADISDECLPLYVCEVDGETKYVFPLSGRGLWGSIWGYVTLNSDLRTIYGAYFSHSSETAGLGARITEEAFQTKFIGKKIADDEEPGISISVVKKVEDPSVQVQAITGATLTSNGLDEMLRDGLEAYSVFLKLGTLNEVDGNE